MSIQREGERLGEAPESVHGGDIFLRERVACISDQQACLTDSTVTNDDQLHALCHSRVKIENAGQQGQEFEGQFGSPKASLSGGEERAKDDAIKGVARTCIAMAECDLFSTE